MRRYRWVRYALTVMLAAGLVLAQAPVFAQGATVTIPQYTAPGGIFNPTITESAYDQMVAALLYDSLVELAPDLSYVPSMAESFSFSADGRSFTFKLRKGLRWSDGRPITAQDVAFTILSYTHPEFPGPAQSDVLEPLRGGSALLAKYDELRKTTKTQQQFVIRALQEWRKWVRTSRAVLTPDAYTVVLNFDDPYCLAMATYGGAVLPRHVWERVPVRAWKTHAYTTNPPVVSGPFKLRRYVRDQFTELVRNPSYWKGAPRVETLIFRVMNAEVSIGAFQKGEVDAVGVGPSQVNPKDLPEIQKVKSAYWWENPQFGYQYMGINLTHPLLQIKEVRQAMMYAIDREALVKDLLQGHGQVMNTIFLPISWAYDAKAINPYKYDPRKAEQLLQQAGFSKGPDGVYQKGGQRLAFTLVYPAGNPVREASAPLIQKYLNDVGFKIELQKLDFRTLIAGVRNSPPGNPPKYDLWLLGWSLPVDPDPWGLWGENDPFNLTRWSPKTVGKDIYDRSIELQLTGRQKCDRATRQAAYRELGKIFNEYAPYVFLYTQNNITAFQNRVQNVNRDIRGALQNVHEWRIEQ